MAARANMVDTQQSNQATGNIGNGNTESDSPNPLFWLTAIVCIVCLVVLIWGGKLYSANNDSGKAVWLTILFCLPLIFQFIGLGVVYFKLVGGDKAVKNFYWFYLVWMLFGLGGYAAMWALYASGNRSWWGQCMSATLIVMLIIPTAGMTYTIMESGTSGPASTTWFAAWWKRNRLTKHIDHYWKTCVLLKDMKDSASRVPYWTLLFFFTMFLVVTYLFSLTFAFHDGKILFDKSAQSKFKVTDRSLEFLRSKNIQEGTLEKLRPMREKKDGYTGEANFLSALKGTIEDEQLYEKLKPLILHTSLIDAPQTLPALYTPMLYTTNAHEENVLQDGPIYNPQSQTPNSKSKYTFYYDSGRAELVTSKAKGQNLTSEEEWAKDYNGRLLNDLAGKLEKYTDRSGKVRLELKGRTDDSDVKGSAYKSNYELSDARARIMQSALVGKFADNTWRNIEWHLTAYSSELAPHQTHPAIETSGLREALIENLKNIKGEILKLSRRPEAEVPKENIEELRKNANKVQALVDSDLKNKPANKVDFEEINHLMGHLDDWTKMYLPPEQRPGGKDIIGLQSQFNEGYNKAKLNRDDKKRVVEVTLVPLQEVSLQTPRYGILSLIDYVIYVVTGMDYIVPTTSFAKFLTIFSNITQAFFMVVLFSAILSLKKYNRPRGVYAISPSHQTFGANASDDILNVVAPNGCDWTVEIEAERNGNDESNQNADKNWLTLKDKPNNVGMGSEALRYQVEENSGTARRLGKIRVKGKGDGGEQVLTVEQEGKQGIVRQTGADAKAEIKCYGIPGSQLFEAGGGSVSFMVETSEACKWKIISERKWITVARSSNVVKCTVGPNTETTPRDGKVKVIILKGRNDDASDRTFTVHQSGAISKVTFDKPFTVCRANADGGAFTVIAPDGYGWTAYVEDKDNDKGKWISIDSADSKTGIQSGTGNGTIQYKVLPNGNEQLREGKINVDGQYFYLHQPGKMISARPEENRDKEC